LCATKLLASTDEGVLKAPSHAGNRLFAGMGVGWTEEFGNGKPVLAHQHPNRAQQWSSGDTAPLLGPLAALLRFERSPEPQWQHVRQSKRELQEQPVAVLWRVLFGGWKAHDEASVATLLAACQAAKGRQESKERSAATASARIDQLLEQVSSMLQKALGDAAWYVGFGLGGWLGARAHTGSGCAHVHTLVPDVRTCAHRFRLYVPHVRTLRSPMMCHHVLQHHPYPSLCREGVSPLAIVKRVCHPLQL
jgi:hypothetical protein